MIKKPENWNETRTTIDEVVASDYASLKVGPYIVKIVDVEDWPNLEYLKLFVDIADGELKGEFTRQEAQFGNWPAQGIGYRSYKDKAIDFFTAFIVAVEKSNKNFIFDWNNPDCLKGKYFVANYAEEEYLKDGQIKTSVKIREYRSIESFKAGKVKPLAIKKYTGPVPTATATAPVPAPDDNRLPWE